MNYHVFIYETGQDVMSCGFISSMYGGVLTASQILNRELTADLENLRKEIEAKNNKKME